MQTNTNTNLGTHISTDNMTWERAAKTALLVQSAVNPVAVARSYAEVTKFLLEELNSTDAVKSHPLNVMFLSALNGMCGIDTLSYWDAYKEVSRLAGEEA